MNIVIVIHLLIFLVLNVILFLDKNGYNSTDNAELWAMAFTCSFIPIINAVFLMSILAGFDLRDDITIRIEEGNK